MKYRLAVQFPSPWSSESEGDGMGNTVRGIGSGGKREAGNGPGELWRSVSIVKRRKEISQFKL